MNRESGKEESTDSSTYLLENINKRKTKIASKYRKMVVFVSCITQIIISTGIGYGLSVMYAELIVVFSVKRANAALIQSLNMGLTMASGIVFAGLIRKLGAGRCIVIGGILSSVGLFISAFADGLTLIILGTGVLSGLGFAINYLSAFVTTGSVFKDDASFYLIMLTSGNSIGQFIVPLLFELFISQYSWSGAFILITGISLQYVPCGVLIHCSRDLYVYDSKPSTKRGNAFCDRALLNDFVLWIINVNTFVICVTVNVEAWFIVDHMVSRGFTQESGSILVSVIGIGSFFGRIVGGILRYKFDCPALYHWIYFCVIAAGLHGLIINLNTFWALFVSCLIYGIVFAVIGALLPAVAYEAAGEEKYPQAMALVNVLAGFGDMFGALLGGVIKDVFGEYDVAFYIAVAGSLFVSATTVVAAYVIRRRESH